MRVSGPAGCPVGAADESVGVGRQLIDSVPDGCLHVVGAQGQPQGFGEVREALGG